MPGFQKLCTNTEKRTVSYCAKQRTGGGDAMILICDTRQQEGKHKNIERYCRKHGIEMVTIRASFTGDVINDAFIGLVYLMAYKLNVSRCFFFHMNAPFSILITLSGVWSFVQNSNRIPYFCTIVIMALRSV